MTEKEEKTVVKKMEDSLHIDEESSIILGRTTTATRQRASAAMGALPPRTPMGTHHHHSTVAATGTPARFSNSSFHASIDGNSLVLGSRTFGQVVTNAQQHQHNLSTDSAQRKMFHPHHSPPPPPARAQQGDLSLLRSTPRGPSATRNDPARGSLLANVALSAHELSLSSLSSSAGASAAEVTSGAVEPGNTVLNEEDDDDASSLEVMHNKEEDDDGDGGVMAVFAQQALEMERSWVGAERVRVKEDRKWESLHAQQLERDRAAILVACRATAEDFLDALPELQHTI